MSGFDRIAIGLDVDAFARAAFDIKLDKWQQQALESTSQRLAIAASRQSGKSVIAALIALRTALYSRNQLVLILSPSLRQSSYMFSSKVVGAVHNLQDQDLLPAQIESITATSISFNQGSRIISLPDSESTIRGYSGVSLLVADESARISQELWVAVRPMLATSHGRLVMVSTPWLREGDFYKAMQADSGFETYSIPATEVPRISPEFLIEEKKALGPFYESEYMVEWLDNADGIAMFRYEDIMAAGTTGKIPPLFDVNGNINIDEIDTAPKKNPYAGLMNR